MKNKNTIQVLSRLSGGDADDLRDLQAMTGRTQADAIRFAVRTTARALRIAEALQTQAILQSPAPSTEDREEKG